VEGVCLLPVRLLSRTKTSDPIIYSEFLQQDSLQSIVCSRETWQAVSPVKLANKRAADTGYSSECDSSTPSYVLIMRPKHCDDNELRITTIQGLRARQVIQINGGVMLPRCRLQTNKNTPSVPIMRPVRKAGAIHTVMV
jgi:hypothetical protein